MVTSIRRFIGPPPFADEEQNRVARTLFTIQLMLLIAAGLAMVVAILSGETYIVMGLVAGSLAISATLWLNHRGHTHGGSFGVFLILLGLGTFLLLAGQGVHSIAITLYPTMIIVASLLLERRTFLVAIALMLISLGLIVFAEVQGWLNTAYLSPASWSDFAMLAVILILAAVTVRFLADSLILNLQRARRHEHALAISNAQLQRDAARLEILVDIDRAILNAQTLDSIAVAVLERMRSLVPARYAGLVLFDFPRNRHEAFVIQTDRGVEIFREWRPAEYFEIMEPLRHGQPHVVADIRALPQQTPMEKQMLSEGTRAYIDAPLSVQGELIGALSFEAVEVAAYDPDRVKMIQHVADHMAIAVSAARLFEAEQKQAVLMTALHEVALNVNAQLDLPALLQTIVTQAAQLIQAEMGALFLLQPDGQTLLEVCRYNLPEADTFTRMQLGEGLSGLVALTGDALAIDDYPRWPLRHAHAVDLPYRSALAAPIKWKDRVLGTITILDTRPGRFSADDLKAVDALAAQAAVAVENARLYTAVQQELAERQRIEAQLRASEERYRLISEVSSDYTFTSALDVQGKMRLVWVAGAFEKITGYSYDEYITHGGWSASLHPDDVAQDAQDMTTLQANHPVVTELRTITKSGAVRWVRVYAHPVWDEFANQLAGIYGAVQDITDRKQVEAERETLIHELEARNAELERFTYTVSHDLKSPLITIRGFLGLLERDARDGDLKQLQADAQRINDATDKMRRLLDDLLELSRIGRLMNPPVTVSFASIVQEAVKLVQGRVDARGVQIEIQPDLPMLSGDRVRLVEVMQNLLDNACKFMGDQPEPRIAIGRDGIDRDGKPILFVRDNGIGIDPQYHEKVFGLFDKLDPQSEGTGIGLALVKRIVEVHGGRLWVESQGVGQGATFYFAMPGATE